MILCAYRALVRRHPRWPSHHRVLLAGPGCLGITRPETQAAPCRAPAGRRDRRSRSRAWLRSPSNGGPPGTLLPASAAGAFTNFAGDRGACSGDEIFLPPRSDISLEATRRVGDIEFAGGPQGICYPLDMPDSSTYGEAQRLTRAALVAAAAHDPMLAAQGLVLDRVPQQVAGSLPPVEASG